MDVYSATRDRNSYNYGALVQAGISEADAIALRRIAMTLHRWFELECGVDNGGLDRDETTGKVWWYSSHSGKRTHTVQDRETGALKRLAEIMSRYPALSYHVQGDPRGAPLYILRPGDVPEGAEADAYYTRGIAVYK
jgi:hypothetical protein